MEIKHYVYFNTPGESEKVKEIANKSLNLTDMTGRLLNTFPELNMSNAKIIADKFYKR